MVSGIAEVTATGGVVAVSVCDGDEAADAAEGGISSVMMCDGKGNTATVAQRVCDCAMDMVDDAYSFTL